MYLCPWCNEFAGEVHNACLGVTRPDGKKDLVCRFQIVCRECGLSACSGETAKEAEQAWSTLTHRISNPCRCC
jgi:hypothetical protein